MEALIYFIGFVLLIIGIFKIVFHFYDKKYEKERERYENQIVASMSFVYRQVERGKLIFTEDSGLFYVTIGEQKWMFYDKLDAAMFVCKEKTKT